MNYFYFNPVSKQYLFPSNFKKFKIFRSFFHPYNISGWLAWNLCLRLSVVRKIFSTSEVEHLLPLENIKRHVTASTVMAFNRGTAGIEQKLSILAFDVQTKEECFFKYAESKLSRLNISNEALTLSRISHLDFVPQLYLHVDGSNYTLIKTSILSGNRLKSSRRIEPALIQVLLQLSRQRVDGLNVYSTKLKTCFAHGDFCPWNIFIKDGKLKIFDWEMAGYYTIGFDLFTFIFQTAFLLYPEKTIELIIKEARVLIDEYFSALQIQEWRPYLESFARVKHSLEVEKRNWKLAKPYQLLLFYAEKI